MKDKWEKEFERIIEESEKIKTYTVSAYLSGMSTMNIEAKNRWEAEQEVDDLLRSVAKALRMSDVKVRIEYSEEKKDVIE